MSEEETAEKSKAEDSSEPIIKTPPKKKLGKGWGRLNVNLTKVKFLNKLSDVNTTDAEDRRRGYLAFVPSLLVSQLNEQRLSVGQSFSSTGAVIFPEAKHRHGILFFADLSGFTKLTEKLAVQSHGAELLCAELDKIYTIILDEVDRWGGDCLKFAGDAILFCWTVQLNPSSTDHREYRNALQTCAARAVKCSLQVHELVKLHPPVAGVKLTLHAGMGAGGFSSCVLGGATSNPKCWEFVVAGSPLEQIAKSEPAAKPGETVVSPELMKLAKKALPELQAEIIDGSRLDPAHGYYRLRSLGVDPAVSAVDTEPPAERLSSSTLASLDVKQLPALQPFIPRNITATLDDKKSSQQLLERQPSVQALPTNVEPDQASGNGGSKAEMRELTTLFVSLVGVDLSADLKHSQLVFGAVQKAVHCYGGVINKLLVDDKGTLALVAFGLPPVTHTDAPTRAIAAACLLLELLKKVGPSQPGGRSVSARIGVTTARTFCGVIGSLNRREFTVMGDSVNLAARLMAACSTIDLSLPDCQTLPGADVTVLEERAADLKNNFTTAQHKEGYALRPLILIDTITAEAVSREVAYGVLPPIMVKGKSKAIPVFHPVRFLDRVGPQEGKFEEFRFVGLGPRENLKKLDDVLFRFSCGIINSAMVSSDVSAGDGLGKHMLCKWLPHISPRHHIVVCASTPATRTKNLYEDGRIVMNTIFTAFRGPILSILQALLDANLIAYETNHNNNSHPNFSLIKHGSSSSSSSSYSSSSSSFAPPPPPQSPYSPQSPASPRKKTVSLPQDAQTGLGLGSFRGSFSSSSSFKQMKKKLKDIGSFTFRNQSFEFPKTRGADELDLISAAACVVHPDLHDDLELLFLMYPERKPKKLTLNKKLKSTFVRNLNGEFQRGQDETKSMENNTEFQHLNDASDDDASDENDGKKKDFNIFDALASEGATARQAHLKVKRLTRLLVCLITNAGSLAEKAIPISSVVNSNNLSDKSIKKLLKTEQEKVKQQKQFQARRSSKRLSKLRKSNSRSSRFAPDDKSFQFLIVLEHGETLMDSFSWDLVDALRSISSGRREGTASFASTDDSAGKPDISSSPNTTLSSTIAKSVGRSLGMPHTEEVKLNVEDMPSTPSTAKRVPLRKASSRSTITEYASPGSRPLLLLVSRPLRGQQANAEYKEFVDETIKSESFISVSLLSDEDTKSLLNRFVVLKLKNIALVLKQQEVEEQLQREHLLDAQLKDESPEKFSSDSSSFSSASSTSSSKPMPLNKNPMNRAGSIHEIFKNTVINNFEVPHDVCDHIFRMLELGELEQREEMPLVKLSEEIQSFVCQLSKGRPLFIRELVDDLFKGKVLNLEVIAQQFGATHSGVLPRPTPLQSSTSLRQQRRKSSQMLARRPSDPTSVRSRDMEAQHPHASLKFLSESLSHAGGNLRLHKHSTSSGTVSENYIDISDAHKVLGYDKQDMVATSIAMSMRPHNSELNDLKSQKIYNSAVLSSSSPSSSLLCCFGRSPKNSVLTSNSNSSSSNQPTMSIDEKIKLASLKHEKVERQISISVKKGIVLDDIPLSHNLILLTLDHFDKIMSARPQDWSLIARLASCFNGWFSLEMLLLVLTASPGDAPSPNYLKDILTALDEEHSFLIASDSPPSWLKSPTVDPTAKKCWRFRNPLTKRALRGTLLHSQVEVIAAACLRFEDSIIKQCLSAEVVMLMFGSVSSNDNMMKNKKKEEEVAAAAHAAATALSKAKSKITEFSHPRVNGRNSAPRKSNTVRKSASPRPSQSQRNSTSTPRASLAAAASGSVEVGRMCASLDRPDHLSTTPRTNASLQSPKTKTKPSSFISPMDNTRRRSTNTSGSEDAPSTPTIKTRRPSSTPSTTPKPRGKPNSSRKSPTSRTNQDMPTASNIKLKNSTI